MARLQDFQTVTPTSSDKLLVVQSQGQGLVPYGSKLDSANPTGTGSLSLNKASGSTLGANAVSLGTGNTASGESAVALGNGNTASGQRSFASGYATTAGGQYSIAEGYNTTSSGSYGCRASGNSTIANHVAQNVFGAYNVADDSTAASTARGKYVEIVGNGTGGSARSNARTLDWSGNEVLAGGLKINGSDDVNKWETGTITFSEGITNNGSTLKKCNGIIYVHLDCYATNAITGRTTILTLPTGFRPTASVRFIIGGSGAHNSYFNRITTAYITPQGVMTLGDIMVPSGSSLIDITADISFPIS